MHMSWYQLFHLGDPMLTLPAGSAIAAWLLATRAWRAAFGWMLVFGLALGLVAATKIAFMGWATGLPGLAFKAVSGHATGFAAVFPTLCWLAVPARAAPARAPLAGAALALSAVVAAALVHAGEHTLAEAVAGWLIGTGAFLYTAWLAGGASGVRAFTPASASAPASAPAPAPRLASASAALACAALAFVASAWVLRSAPLNYWMIKVALVLSGNAAPVPWTSADKANQAPTAFFQSIFQEVNAFLQETPHV
jgi:hypothetical protein